MQNPLIKDHDSTNREVHKYIDRKSLASHTSLYCSLPGSMRMNFNQQERLTPDILPVRMEEQSTTTTTTTPQPILTQPTNFQWQSMFPRVILLTRL